MYCLLFVTICLLCWMFYLKVLRKLTVGGYRERYVLVTGCDTGFGNLLAKKLDILGFRVFACCLNKSGVESLQSECSVNVTALQMDVSDDESIEQAMDIVRSTLPNDKGLWAIVNNAGIVGGIGPSSWQTRQDYDKTLAVNLYGVIMVTKACMPLVVKAKGRVINTASIMGRIAFFNPTYAVSKYGVEAFSDILRRENLIDSTGVSVHIIEPGFFKTLLLNREMAKVLIEAKVKELPSDIKNTLPANIVNLMTAKSIEFVEKIASPNVSEVVDVYIDAIVSRFPKTRYLVGFDANFIYRPLWMLPEWISDRIIRHMMRRSRKYSS